MENGRGGYFNHFNQFCIIPNCISCDLLGGPSFYLCRGLGSFLFFFLRVRRVRRAEERKGKGREDGESTMNINININIDIIASE